MSVDEVYMQNQKVLTKEEEKKKEEEEMRKKLFPERIPIEEKPIETADEFLKKEGPSRLFTVPQLTTTGDLSSDDVFFYSYSLYRNYKLLRLLILLRIV